MANQKVKGHGLRVARDTTPDEPNVGTCKCGWSTRQRTRAQVREAYREHLSMLSEREPVGKTVVEETERSTQIPTEGEDTAVSEHIRSEDLN